MGTEKAARPLRRSEYLPIRGYAASRRRWAMLMCSIIVPLVLWHLMFSKAVPGPPKPKAAVPAPNLAKMRRPIPTPLHTPHPTLPPTQKASEAQTEQRPLEFRQSFVNLGPNVVGGWLDYEDAYGARLVSDEQLRQGIAGSVGEIGVHHGLFFLALALSGTNDRSSSAAHPHLFAADVFSHQEVNFDRSGKGDREIFLNNCKRFAGLGEQDILLLEGSSLDGLLTKLRSSGTCVSKPADLSGRLSHPRMHTERRERRELFSS